MFGYHKRHQSLISVKEIEKAEKKMERYNKVTEMDVTVAEADDEEIRTPRQQRNLLMIYMLFLAEAIMASSLSSQIAVLVPAAAGCMSMNTSFLRSIFECAYYLGSTAGVCWGWAADRAGRRRIALLGLMGMAVCCISMGFATTFATFAALRLAAGCISSAVTVAALTMLADVTHGSAQRTRTVARLPMIAICGSVGPLVATGVRNLCAEHTHGLFARFPGLSGQIVCATFVLTIAVAEALLLEETLPQRKTTASGLGEHPDPEKAAFLGQSLPNNSDDSLNITIIEALNDEAAAPLSSRITITQLLSAPSVLMLLASFSVLSLHSSTFEMLLPHLGHTESHFGGMGIPCTWLGLIVLAVKAVAAQRILRIVPFVVNKVGLLPMYRRISTIFPALFIIVPLAGATAHAMGAAPAVSAIISTIAMLVKNIFAGAAQVLVLLLVLSAAPDASSTGTVIGVVSISQLFKAFTVGISGIAYYLSDEYSIVAVNISLWGALATIALIGAGITSRMRETPRVGTDIPAECLAWQGLFDSESDEEAGF